MGLEVSERTAHRIMAGQVRPLRSVLSRLTHKPSDGGAEVDLLKDSRGLRITRDDQDEFSRVMERDFALLADRYYLTLRSDPRVRVTRGRITVTFEVDEGD